MNKREIENLIHELMLEYEDLLKEIERHESAATINRAVANAIERKISKLEDVILKHYS